MGMPMANIHSPSLDASASANPPSDKAQDDVPVLDLIRQKDRLEGELSALGSVLDSHGVNMSTTLTTFDGYPRADIDVAQIRTTRARIIHLRNDHKALMSRIERGLHAHFAAQQASPSPTAADTISSPSNGLPNGSALAQTNGTQHSPSINSTTSQIPAAGPPFAMINSVSPGSPASAANLAVGDRVQRFGDADFFNHEKLSRVAQIVQRSEGRVVDVTVLRRREGGVEEQLQLTLTPQRDWGGRGLLGCHLLPL